MKRWIFIPARRASTRLPDKLLRPILNKPLLQWTYESACQAHVDRVVIAVDDEALYELAKEMHADVVMTDKAHPSGTDRIAEAAEMCEVQDDDMIINLQGDEPLFAVDNIMQLFDTIQSHPTAAMVTLCEQIKTLEEALDPHAVKVVHGEDFRALYFSRAPIPYARDSLPNTLPALPMYRHIGVYGWHYHKLKQMIALPSTSLEQLECLEQLRLCYYGLDVIVPEALVPTLPGVDTEQDLQRIEAALKAS